MPRKPSKKTLELADATIDQNVSQQDPSPKIVPKEKNVRKKAEKPSRKVINVSSEIKLENHKELSCSCVDWYKVTLSVMGLTITGLFIWACYTTTAYIESLYPY